MKTNLNTGALLACPKCKSTKSLRANIMQDVDVSVTVSGDIDNGYDHSDPELDDSGKLYCSDCGINLILKYGKKGYSIKKSKRAKAY